MTHGSSSMTDSIILPPSVTSSSPSRKGDWRDQSLLRESGKEVTVYRRWNNADDANSSWRSVCGNRCLTEGCATPS